MKPDVLLQDGDLINAMRKQGYPLFFEFVLEKMRRGEKPDPISSSYVLQATQNIHA